MDIIEIKGKKYRLVPIDEENSRENRSRGHLEAKKYSILDDYVEKPSSGVAQPKVFDAKKRLDEKRAILAKNSVLKNIPQHDSDLSKFGDLIVGEGLTQTF